MYCATSFWEREQSSKRAWMYLERLWCSEVPFTGAASGVLVAVRFTAVLFDACASRSSPRGAMIRTARARVGGSRMARQTDREARAR